MVLVDYINQSQFLFVMFKLSTNKNHSYKHNEQINNQKNMVLVDYIGIFFYMRQYFWPHTVDVDTIFSLKLSRHSQRWVIFKKMKTFHFQRII
jgi:hypothetical protein